MPELKMLELWNVIVIFAGVLAIKLCEYGRNKELARKNVNDLRMGLIVGLYWDAQIAIVTGIFTLSWLLADVAGGLVAIIFAFVCILVLTYAPKVTRTVVMAFSVPKVNKRRRRPAHIYQP